jgi:hypothetical protein
MWHSLLYYCCFLDTIAQDHIKTVPSIIILCRLTGMRRGAVLPAWYGDGRCAIKGWWDTARFDGADAALSDG